MRYEQMKAQIFATGNIVDGYNGNIISVGFALEDGKIIIVHESGYNVWGVTAQYNFNSREEAFQVLEDCGYVYYAKYGNQHSLYWVRIKNKNHRVYKEIEVKRYCIKNTTTPISKITLEEELNILLRQANNDERKQDDEKII